MWDKPKNLKDETMSADHHSCIYYYYLIKPFIPRAVQIFLAEKARPVSDGEIQEHLAH